MGGDEKKSGAGHNNPGNHGSYGRRKLLYSPYTMALGGLVFAATIYYLAKYAMKPPETKPRDATRATSNKPEDAPPRRYT